MKPALIRLLTIATLATSMSCFAATGESKHDAAPNASAAKQQEGCPGADDTKKQKQDKKTQDGDQDKRDFDRVLLGIYG